MGVSTQSTWGVRTQLVAREDTETHSNRQAV